MNTVVIVGLLPAWTLPLNLEINYRRNDAYPHPIHPYLIPDSSDTYPRCSLFEDPGGLGGNPSTECVTQSWSPGILEILVHPADMEFCDRRLGARHSPLDTSTVVDCQYL